MICRVKNVCCHSCRHWVEEPARFSPSLLHFGCSVCCDRLHRSAGPKLRLMRAYCLTIARLVTGTPANQEIKTLKKSEQSYKKSKKGRDLLHLSLLLKDFFVKYGLSITFEKAHSNNYTESQCLFILLRRFYIKMTVCIHN